MKIEVEYLSFDIEFIEWAGKYSVFAQYSVGEQYRSQGLASAELLTKKEFQESKNELWRKALIIFDRKRKLEKLLS